MLVVRLPICLRSKGLPPKAMASKPQGGLKAGFLIDVRVGGRMRPMKKGSLKGGAAGAPRPQDHAKEGFLGLTLSARRKSLA